MEIVAAGAETKPTPETSLMGPAVVVFTFCGLIFYAAPVRTPWDSWYSIHMAYSFLHGHWGDLSDFASFFKHHTLIPGRDGHIYSFYPIGPSLFSLPVVIIADQLIPNLAGLLMKVPVSMELEAMTVALWCAFATVLMLILARRLTGSALVAIFAAFVFAFCSPILSTATRALWQHGPVVVCTAATMLVLHAGERRPALIPLAAFFVAMAFACRPLAAPLVALVSVYVGIYHRPQLVSFLTIGIAIAAVWGAYNYAIWGSIIPQYYKPGFIHNDYLHWIGRTAGPLISPSRGLLVFSPVFLFSVAGIVMKLRSRRFDRFDTLYLALIVCQLGLIAISPVWWAGHSFGPRFLTDIVPMLIYFMLPVLIYLRDGARTALGATAATLFAAAGVVSLLINAQGAFDPAVSNWNVDPIVLQPGDPVGYPRLWDWRDLQFLRGTGFDDTHPAVQFFRLIEGKPI